MKFDKHHGLKKMCL